MKFIIITLLAILGLFINGDLLALTISLPYDSNTHLSNFSIDRDLNVDYLGRVEKLSLTTIGNAYTDFKENGTVDVDWLGWSRRSDNSGDWSWGNLTITKNPSVYARTGRFSCGVSWSWGRGDIVIDVNQSGAPVVVSLDGNLSYGLQGGEGKFQIETSSDAAWHIDCEWVSGDENDWITFSKTSGIGSCDVSYVVSPSVLCRERVAKIVVASKEFVFTQEGNLVYDGPKGIVSGPVTIMSKPINNEEFKLYVDGNICVATYVDNQYVWQPQSIGEHTLSVVSNENSWDSIFNVIKLDFFVQPAPNPPMPKDTNISIYPVTDHFGTGGGGLAISTSGSGTWTAVASEPWITLNSTSGTAGKPLAFRVSANTNVEERTAYIYVSGHVYTVTQDGLCATVDKSNETFEHNGGS